MSSDGSMCQNMAACYSIWQHMVAYGSIWEHIVALAEVPTADRTVGALWGVFRVLFQRFGLNLPDP